MKSYKSGFVNIIGKPNVGKSTLMNAMIGEKLSVITPKAQTTRHRILGFLSGDSYQIIFSDTPGVLQPHYKLHESMMKVIDEALYDADLVLLMTTTDEEFDNEKIIDYLKEKEIPGLLLINKVDQSDQDKVNQSIKKWEPVFGLENIIPLSATLNFNIDLLKEKITDKLPEGEPYYDPEELTDRPLRFFVAEMIRAKILNLYHKEVPYSVEVVIEEYKEEENIDKIRAFIFVARESQKMIIIGKQGKAIKKLGTEARKEIESFVGKKVFLDLSVKVSKDWRNDLNQLKRFGYDL